MPQSNNLLPWIYQIKLLATNKYSTQCAKGKNSVSPHTTSSFTVTKLTWYVVNILVTNITHLLITASTMTWIGFKSVSRWINSIACLTMRTAMSFFPLLRPCIMREFVSLSMIGHWAFRNLLTEYRPAVWGRKVACLAGDTAM